MPFKKSKLRKPTPLEPPKLLRQLFVDLIRPAQQGGVDRAGPDSALNSEEGSGFVLASYELAHLALSTFRYWLLVIPAIVFALLAYSYEPVTRMRAEPPPEFIVVSTKTKIDQQAWARAYWSCAKSIHLKYTYRVPLPEDPPPEFYIVEEQTVPQETADQIRLLYWKQLQIAWLSSSAWETTYTLRFDWMHLLGRNTAD